VPPALERRFDVLLPPLIGHAGGAPLPPRATPAALADAVEGSLDDAGRETARFA
jgi:hypothetical protein